ncbi:hypothetical protein HDE_12165 [Halotydeus destructor]|nr:hypothetical protein HDE_12165 [Halotydeus destructor]
MMFPYHKTNHISYFAAILAIVSLTHGHEMSFRDQINQQFDWEMAVHSYIGFVFMGVFFAFAFLFTCLTCRSDLKDENDGSDIENLDSKCARSTTVQRLLYTERSESSQASDDAEANKV